MLAPVRVAVCMLSLSAAHTFTPSALSSSARRTQPAKWLAHCVASPVAGQRSFHVGVVGARRGYGGGLRMLAGEMVSVVENVLKYPQTWTSVLLGGILALGWAFERAVDTVEEHIDERLMPVVQQTVLELATLGFIGLVIQTLAIGHKSSWLSALSETFLGDHDILFELFEQLHQGLFAATIAFFITCAVLIGSLNGQFQEWDYDRRNDYLEFKLEEYDWKLANPSKPFARRGWNYLAQSMVIKGERDIERDAVRQLLDELAKPRKARIAEFLRFRERFMVHARRDGLELPKNFRFSDYLEEHASKNLRELVSVDLSQQALIWLPVAVVGLAAEAAADLATGVGHEATGLFAVYAATQVILGGWSLWNFFQIRGVKARLRPQLSNRKHQRLCSDCLCAGYVCSRRGYQVMRLLPPAYALAGGRAPPPGGGSLGETGWQIGPGIFERMYAAPARSSHDALFGLVGANGAAFYLTSMKTNLFNAVVSLAVGTNMLLDSHSPQVLLALMPAVGAIILAPPTFMMYNFATSVEDYKDLAALRKVMSEQRKTTFKSKIRTLFKLCQIFDTVMGLGAAACCLTDKQPSWKRIRKQGNPDALLNLLAVFDIADLDKDGFICKSEAAALASTLGYRLTEMELQMLMGLLDVNGDGYIEFKEWASTILYTGWATVTDADQTMKRVFAFFDINGNGRIEVNEMLSRLEVLGFDTDGVMQLFSDIAGPGQGGVTRAEFQTYVQEDYDYIQASTQRMAKMDLSGDAHRLRAARYARQAQALLKMKEEEEAMEEDADLLLGARGLTVRGRVGEQIGESRGEEVHGLGARGLTVRGRVGEQLGRGGATGKGVRAGEDGARGLTVRGMVGKQIGRGGATGKGGQEGQEERREGK